MTDIANARHNPAKRELRVRFRSSPGTYVYWPVDEAEIEALLDRRSMSRVRSVKQVRLEK
jgi:hypothetical protein